MNLKYRLTVEIFQQLEDTEKTTIDNLFLSVWKNTNHTNGLALTKTGLTYLTDTLNLEQWKFSMPDITSGDVVMMDRYMIYPYYLVSQKTKTHKNLIIFDESTATQLLLYNNNLRLLLSAYDNDSAVPVIKHQK
jgi:hypothetical protein